MVLPLFLLDVAMRRLASWLAFSICVELIVDVFMLWGMGMIYGSVLGVLGVLLLGEVIGLVGPLPCDPAGHPRG